MFPNNCRWCSKRIPLMYRNNWCYPSDISIFFGEKRQAPQRVTLMISKAASTRTWVNTHIYIYTSIGGRRTSLNFHDIEYIYIYMYIYILYINVYTYYIYIYIHNLFYICIVPYIIIIYTLKYTYYIIGTVILNILYTIIYDIYICKYKHTYRLNHSDPVSEQVTLGGASSNWQMPREVTHMGILQRWGSIFGFPKIDQLV
jgi:hypothetical protein